MCGRYTLRRPDLLQKLSYQTEFEEFSTLRIVPRFNVAPSQHVAVVRPDKSEVPKIGLVTWGLIPSWTKGKPKQRPINARAETIATSGIFRQAYQRRRCLVPADGFYEWRKIGEQKPPMYIHRRDGAIFAFAGLWERWRPDEEAEPVDTMTIITTTPNALMATIHDRMPVILAESDWQRWLDRKIPGEGVADLLKPCDADDFVATPVSTTVNSPHNDSADCIEPLTKE